jgi:multisubunit Na+/H+ antiporter MnhF subunit
MNYDKILTNASYNAVFSIVIFIYMLSIANSLILLLRFGPKGRIVLLDFLGVLISSMLLSMSVVYSEKLLINVVVPLLLFAFIGTLFLCKLLVNNISDEKTNRQHKELNIESDK